jgi:dipeptidyl aminopeptidase/acylaminoacyl peptidase
MDDRVNSAIANWGPRFTSNGVTAADFKRITAGVERWEDWCAAWCSVAAEYEALGIAAAEQGRTISAGGHLAQAAVYYHFAKFVFVEDVEQMRAAHRRATKCLNDALPYLTPPGRRVELPFEGTHLVGILRCPTAEGPHPTVLMFSGLDSAKEELRATEDTFLARGLATFSVDGPGQGEAEQALPIRGDWSAPGWAIVEGLSAIPDVDGNRLGLWGVSLGGYYAARVAAALGDRVRACVALSGPFDFGASWDALPLLTRQTFAVRAKAADEPQARQIANTLTLEGYVEAIAAPLLVVFGRKDRLFPWQDAERLVNTATCETELLMLEEGNHGCANIASWHRPYTADWLAARLGGHTTGVIR